MASGTEVQHTHYLTQRDNHLPHEVVRGERENINRDIGEGLEKGDYERRRSLKQRDGKRSGPIGG